MLPHLYLTIVFPKHLYGFPVGNFVQSLLDSSVDYLDIRHNRIPRESTAALFKAWFGAGKPEVLEDVLFGLLV